LKPCMCNNGANTVAHNIFRTVNIRMPRHPVA
jgi:hypothetical protein